MAIFTSMPETEYHLIGLMSGTSGDGLDIAYVRFSHRSSWTYEILRALTIPFPPQLGEQLASAYNLGSLDLHLLDVEFGRWMGEKVLEFCRENGIKPQAVASHGHTVFHQPAHRLSLQIGNGWAIREACGLPVINDFRMKDVQLGGQGAPLVPIGDQLLFHDSDFCLNLGGISNISMDSNGQRVAFDCTPFNVLLNREARRLGLSFDKNGEAARSGETNLALLEQLNSLPYYQTPGAKSLGREDIERDFYPILDSFGLAAQDVLCTLVEHFAIRITQVIKDYRTSPSPRVLLTGGGAYNAYFVERLAHCLQNRWRPVDTDPLLVEFKEAMVFAFLGVLRLRNEVNCLASVTGASNDSCGGIFYP